MPNEAINKIMVLNNRTHVGITKLSIKWIKYKGK